MLIHIVERLSFFLKVYFVYFNYCASSTQAAHQRSSFVSHLRGRLLFGFVLVFPPLLGSAAYLVAARCRMLNANYAYAACDHMTLTWLHCTRCTAWQESLALITYVSWPQGPLMIMGKHSPARPTTPHQLHPLYTEEKSRWTKRGLDFTNKFDQKYNKIKNFFGSPHEPFLWFPNSTYPYKYSRLLKSYFKFISFSNNMMFLIFAVHLVHQARWLHLPLGIMS